MWTSKLMVDGVWRGDVVPTPDLQASIGADANAFRMRSLEHARRLELRARCDEHPRSCQWLRDLHEIYTPFKPDYTGQVTVPVLWDKAEGRIASNNSAEILRLIDEFGPGSARPLPGASVGGDGGPQGR
jgi:hypothetical protein